MSNTDTVIVDALNRQSGRRRRRTNVVPQSVEPYIMRVNYNVFILLWEKVGNS